MKRVRNVVVCILLMAMVCTLCVFFTGCEEKPLYEIKLYDDDWNELVKSDSGKGYKWDFYEFEYDGKPKGFNAIAYRKGKEFYRVEYKEYKTNNAVKVFRRVEGGDYQGMTTYEEFPTEVGVYYLGYKFFRAPENIYWNPYFDEPFPTTSYEIKFKII